MWLAHAAGCAGAGLATVSGGLPPDAASGGLFVVDHRRRDPAFAKAKAKVARYSGRFSRTSRSVARNDAMSGSLSV
jgi:hypothetical protein